MALGDGSAAWRRRHCRCGSGQWCGVPARHDRRDRKGSAEREQRIRRTGRRRPPQQAGRAHRCRWRRPRTGAGIRAGSRRRSPASGPRWPPPLRLMAVHAHPDDESSKGAASLAKYSAEGAGVVVVSCTGGERGDVLNPKLDHRRGRRPGPADRRDGKGRRDSRRRARLARVSRLRVPRGCTGDLGRCRPAASARWTRRRRSPPWSRSSGSTART